MVAYTTSRSRSWTRWRQRPSRLAVERWSQPAWRLPELAPVMSRAHWACTPPARRCLSHHRASATPGGELSDVRHRTESCANLPFGSTNLEAVANGRAELAAKLLNAPIGALALARV